MLSLPGHGEPVEPWGTLHPLIFVVTGIMNETNEDLWEVVATASGMTQAKIITGRIESEGIPTQLRYEAAGTIYGVTIDGLGEVRILVPVPDLERAKELLSRSYDDSEMHWEQ
jgi:hypothetical protein